MKTILAIIIAMAAHLASAQIYLKELDEDMTHPYSYQVAITDQNGKTLFVETQDEDKQIAGYGHDFYTVYRKSTNTIYVKTPQGVVISGLKLEGNQYAEAVDFDTMTDHEQYHARSINHAFTVIDPDADTQTSYNKNCKSMNR